MRPRHSFGFTLTELMITLAVVGITLMFASPSIVVFIKNYRLTTQINEFLADLQVARNNAVSQGSPVSVCASSDTSNAAPTCSTTSWASGHLVFTDVNGNGAVDAGDTLIRVAEPLSGGNTIVATNLTTAGKVQFRPTGMPSGISGGPTATFTICDDRSGAFGRVITVTLTGRASIATATCP